MLNKMRGIIREYDMINRGDTVICGLSGGADSVCLLIALHELSGELGFTVEAVHVNHGIRGDEADRDENFCRELCSRLNIGLTVIHCDVPKYASGHSLSEEESARILRYRAFSEVSDGKKIATAHNADDNLETAVHNLIRGTALKGICGIPPVRGNIIRPLLAVSRREIEDFLSERDRDFVTDSTNLTEDYTRNRIRHHIIPLMKELNPSLVETAVNSLDGLRSENDFIESAVDEAMGRCLTNGVISGLIAYHPVIRRRCISRILTQNGLPVSHKRLAECDDILRNGGKLNISGDLYFVSDGRTAELKTITPTSSEIIAKPLEIGENAIYSDSRLICELIECDDLTKLSQVHRNLTFYLLDYDKIIGRAVIRSRRFGDKIQLRGRNFTSSVKKIINEKIPKELRSTLHFIEDDEGTVFGERIGIADRVSPDSATKRLLKITVVRN